MKSCNQQTDNMMHIFYSAAEWQKLFVTVATSACSILAKIKNHSLTENTEDDGHVLSTFVIIVVVSINQGVKYVSC